MLIFLLVQEQYILVHEAILEFILCGFNELEGNALEHALKMLEKVDPKKKQTGFAELFQVGNKCNIPYIRRSFIIQVEYTKQNSEAHVGQLQKRKKSYIIMTKLLTLQDVSKSGNPTLECSCVHNIECTDIIFHSDEYQSFSF